MVSQRTIKASVVLLTVVLGEQVTKAFVPIRNGNTMKSQARKLLSNLQMASTFTPIAHHLNMTDLGGFENIPRGSSIPNTFADPASIEFVASKDMARDDDELLFECELDQQEDCMYPFVNMLRGSARYIAEHREEVAVFHVPGDILEMKNSMNSLFDDIALSWLLGLKIVIVVGCRYDAECSTQGFPNGHECRNSLRVTDDKLLRAIEEEAGYVRFEVERLLNRCLRMQVGLSPSKLGFEQGGNVLGGNFYMAKPFGIVRGVDYQNTGYPTTINVEKIMHSVQNHDVVLLTTVGTSRLGECINVNGNHLAASVAAALKAHKLVYFSSSGAVLRKQQEPDKTLQDIPVSFAKDLLDYHNVQVHRAGFANFELAKENLEPSSVEMLLHLGWSSWALEQGVKRAHIVNPGDGSLLEELYSARHGVNTCLFRDEEQDEFFSAAEDDEDWKHSLDAMHLPENQDSIMFSELPTGKRHW